VQQALDWLWLYFLGGMLVAIIVSAIVFRSLYRRYKREQDREE
jgi:hypothetical protein